MNTATITMPREQAREKLRAVRNQLHRRADAEYQAIAAGYAELAAGRPLLNLRDCFIECPLDEQGRPRLAIARSDRRSVHFQRSGPTRGDFDTRRNSARSDTLRIEVELPSYTLKPNTYWHWSSGYSLVPLIPADVMGDLPLGTAIASTFILWEVEKWSNERIGRHVDRDPYLLRHLGGDLYTVLAEWELTELERAVMAGRARG